MLRRWCTVLLSLTLLAKGKADAAFENTAIVRTVDLGGSLVGVTTTFAVKALEAGSQVYTLAFGDEERQKTSWLEAKVKGQSQALKVVDRGRNSKCVNSVQAFRVFLILHTVTFIFWILHYPRLLV
jgi:oligosaccharyltransferase complex subunit alpha (ribophorin I)